MIKKVPDIEVPIIKKGVTSILSLKDEFQNKNIVLFGVPGAFTPTCSEKHLPDFIKYYDLLEKKNINNIYCLSVNDEHVMKAWLLSHSNSERIIGIADGNSEITKYFDLLTDKTQNFMGYRSSRFSMIIYNNTIKNIFIEKPGVYEVSSPQKILEELSE